MSVNLELLKVRLENANREINRRTINIEIALLVQIIKELERFREKEFER